MADCRFRLGGVVRGYDARCSSCLQAAAQLHRFRLISALPGTVQSSSGAGSATIAHRRDPSFSFGSQGRRLLRAGLASLPEG
jgi:hypothetical protein